MLQDLASAPNLVSEGLSPLGDGEQVDRELSAFLAESSKQYAANPHLSSFFRRVTEFVLRGGKRLRPRLCLASYRIITGRTGPPPRPVWLGAASLELFHAFMLVHDDLVDVSRTRRGVPSLHEELRGDGEERAQSKRAADLGLVAGDLLFALGMRLFDQAGLEGMASGRSRALLAGTLLETGLGQALDIIYDDHPLGGLAEEQVIDVYLRKTARFSVSLPMVLAAAVGGAPTEACEALERYGDVLGLAFQLRNDLDALAGHAAVDANPDLDLGKRTLVLWMTHRLLAEPGRRALVDALAAPVSPERRCLLHSIIHASGAIESCQAYLRRLCEQSMDRLAAVPLDVDCRRRFAALTSLLEPEVARRSSPTSANGHSHVSPWVVGIPPVALILDD